jgi:hypothetical protein
MNINSDPFIWWREHKEQFPILSKLARLYQQPQHPVRGCSVAQETF